MLSPELGIKGLTRVPRIQVCCPLGRRRTTTTGLGLRLRDGAWDSGPSLIPVVTFLAPLASNFEGLKDR